MSSRSLIICSAKSTIGMPPLAMKSPVFVVIYPKWRGNLLSLLLWVPTERWSRDQNRQTMRRKYIVTVTWKMKRLVDKLLWFIDMIISPNWLFRFRLGILLLSVVLSIRSCLVFPTVLIKEFHHVPCGYHVCLLEWLPLHFQFYLNFSDRMTVTWL